MIKRRVEAPPRGDTLKALLKRTQKCVYSPIPILCHFFALNNNRLWSNVVYTIS